MKNISKAIIEVMKAVKSIGKNSNVGAGTRSSYKGVQDKDVKQAYQKAMIENGLVILPIEVNDELHINRWTDNYGKAKQSVFCSVKTKYLLLHTSGESQEIAGYGHGVDSQDKAAGKATTYAMKYALLYTFMTPTGDIDDTDNTHSEEHDTPDTRKPVTDEQVQTIADHAIKHRATIEAIEKNYILSATQKTTLEYLLKASK